MTRFAEVEQFLNQNGFTKIKTGKKHVFSNGVERLSVMKSAEISRKNFEKIQKQVQRSLANKAQLDSLPDEAENPQSLSSLLADSFHRIIDTCGKCSGTPMTISSFMNVAGIPQHRLTALINSASQHQDIDTLFALKAALLKVGIDPKPLKDALQKLDGLTSPTTREEESTTSAEEDNNEEEEEQTEIAMDEEKEDSSTSAVIVKRADESESRPASLYPWHHNKSTSFSNKPASGPRVIVPIVKPKQQDLETSVAAALNEEKKFVEPTNTLEPQPQARIIPPTAVKAYGFSTKQQAILEIASILGQFPNLEDNEYREITNFAVDFMKFNRH